MPPDQSPKPADAGASQKIEFDGQVHEFPKDFSQSDIQKALKTYASQTHSTTSKGLSHDTGRKIDLSPRHNKHAVSPDFISRFAESLGIPTSKAEVQHLMNNAFDKPGGLAQGFVEDYLRNLKETLPKSWNEMEEARKNVKEGGPFKENAGKAAAAELDAAAAIIPVIGPAVKNVAEDSFHGHYAGVAGTALGTIVNTVLLKMGEPYDAKQQASKLSFASGAASGERGFNYPQAFQKVLPDLEETARKLGKPSTVGQLQKISKETLQRTSNEFNLALNPIRTKQIMPSAISNEILSHITPDLAQTREGVQYARELRRRALDFQKPWSMEQLDQGRMNANARLKGYWDKGATGKGAALRTQADSVVDTALAKGAQDIVYPTMDKLHNKPAGYYRELKSKQGSLIELNEKMNDRITQLANITASKSGAPLIGGENISAFGRPETGRLGFSLHKLNEILRAPEEAANLSVERAFKGTSGPKRTALGLTLTLPIRALSNAATGEQTIDELQKLLHSDSGKWPKASGQ